MKIAIGVSVAPGGHDLFRLLLDSAAAMASGRHDIEVAFTCHDEEQRRRMLDYNAVLKIADSYVVEPETPTYLHANSVTHSRCVNKLFESMRADVAVICDFDVVLTYKNWDEALVDEIVRKGVSFLGTPYAYGSTAEFELPAGRVLVGKYQRKPNCTFLAFSPKRVRSVTSHLCDFHIKYRGGNSLPLQLISTPDESRCYGLPVGMVRQIDAGSLIPQLIEKLATRYCSLERRAGTYSILKSVKIAHGPSFQLPEEYFYERKPFLAHLRKGSAKVGKDKDGVYSSESFIRDVRALIDVTK